MKYFLLAFILFGITAHAQKTSYPLAAKTADKLENCVPSNWRIISKTEGDLNKDGLNDFAVVIQKINGKMIVDDRDENPRTLLIYFKNKNTNQYDLMEQSNTFIPLNDADNMDDRFDTIRIKNGILNIELHYFCNAGCWEMSNTVYKFRFQNNQFELIGYDSDETHRASGEITNYSINFSTNTMEIGKGNIQSDKIKTTKKKFNLEKLKNFKTFKEPQSWAFLDIYI